MKTPEQILEEYESFTRWSVIEAMERYAKLYHKNELEKLGIPTIIEPDCKHPISSRKRDSMFNLKCTKCGEIL